MTAQEQKNFIRATLLAQRTIEQEFIVFDSVIDFITQSITTGIPAWTALLDFNADGTGDGAFSTHPDDNGNLRFWNSKVANNIGHQPPTNPDITEDDFWIEVSPSSGSAIKEWAPGVFGAGLVIVYWNGELCLLTNPSRPFNSSVSPDADKANWKPIIADNWAQLHWKKVAKASTTSALPSYTVVTLGGVDGCLRATANGPFTSKDGVTINVGDSLLVLHEDDWQRNKVYELTSLGQTAVPPFISGSPWVLTPRQDMRYASFGDQYINATIQVKLGTKNGGKIFTNVNDGSTGAISTWAEFPHVTRAYFQASPTLVVGDVLKHDFTKVSSAADKPWAVVIQRFSSGSYYILQQSGLATTPITGSPAVGDYIYVSPSGVLTTTESDWIFGVYQSGGVLIGIQPRNQDHFRGEYASLVALEAALPTANPGDYAIVNGGVSVDAVKYIWDDEDVQWIIASGAPVADATPSVKGIAKLYNDYGNNTDGAVTQQVINKLKNKLNIGGMGISM